MLKDYRLCVARVLSAAILFVLAFAGSAADFCVDSADELQTALIQATSNNQSDRILIVQGTYTGGFVYTSSERQALQVLGGYAAGCASRTLDPTNTALQGSGTDRVLTLTTTNGGAFTLEGVTVSGGIKTGDGGGLYADTSSNIALRDNVIQDNTATAKGGGAYITSESTMYVERNTFSNNKGAGHSGGLSVFTDHGTLAMSNNSFLANEAQNGWGGGASLTTALGSLNIVGNAFIDNRTLTSFGVSTKGGGLGVSITNTGIAILSGNNFKGNSAGSESYSPAYGGGAYISASSGQAVLTDNVFENNRLNYSSHWGGGTIGGGGSITTSTGNVSLVRNIFINNTATHGPGGGVSISTESGAATVTYNRFDSNHAGEGGSRSGTEPYGGGAHLSTSTGAVTLSNNVFFNNNTKYGGGALIAGGGIVTLTNNTLENNAGSSQGGGLWLQLKTETETALLYNNLFWNNHAPTGGDLWIDNDSDNDSVVSPLTLIHNNFNRTGNTGYWTKIAVTIAPSNLNLNPRFDDTDTQHLAADSPMIDQGNNDAPALPSSDMDGEARIQGAAVDIGADEFASADKMNQTIAFGAPPTIVVEGIGTVTATGGGSGNPVIFSSQTSGVCSSSGPDGSTITGLATGTCTIAANQTGNDDYNPAPEVTQSFSIDKADQAITFGPAPTIVVGDTGTVSATGGGSGNPVIFSSQTSAICSSGGSDGSTITGLTTGTCIIAANQAGNTDYNPAREVTQSFSIGTGQVFAMTFDPQTKGTEFPYGNSYSENGICATSYSNNAQFGDPLHPAATTPLYFHGVDEYVEFRLVSGGAFDLVSFDLVTNGFDDRWIETSKTVERVSLGQPLEPTTVQFSGGEYAGITWFRIGTSWYATQVDTIRLAPSNPADCQTGLLTIDGATFAVGTHTRASQTSIVTQGAVTVQTGANVTLRAPLHRYGPGLRVATGAVFRAQAGAVNCSAAARAPAATAAPASAAEAAVETAPATAPLPFTGMDALPPWVQERFAARGIDRQAIAQAVLDPQGQWVLMETTQALDPADRNETSDLYRLDLLDDRLILLSRTPAGRAGNGPSRYPAADALGDWIVFQSEADNLVTGDDNGVSDIFLYEVPFGMTRRLTTAKDQASAHPALDAAGQDLLYDRQDENGRRQILADTLWGGTPPVALASAADRNGVPLDHHHPAIGADGRFVASLSGASAAIGSAACQVHFHDRDRGRSGVQPCPAALAAASETARPQFSADGIALEWYLPGEANPVRLGNPLLAAPAATAR